MSAPVFARFDSDTPYGIHETLFEIISRQSSRKWSSGLPILDQRNDRPGDHPGTVLEILGDQYTGKSTLMYNIIASMVLPSAEHPPIHVAFVDLGFTFNINRFTRILQSKYKMIHKENPAQYLINDALDRVHLLRVEDTADLVMSLVQLVRDKCLIPTSESCTNSSNKDATQTISESYNTPCSDNAETISTPANTSNTIASAAPSESLSLSKQSPFKTDQTDLDMNRTPQTQTDTIKTGTHTSYGSANDRLSALFLDDLSATFPQDRAWQPLQGRQLWRSLYSVLKEIADKFEIPIIYAKPSVFRRYGEYEPAMHESTDFYPSQTTSIPMDIQIHRDPGQQTDGRNMARKRPSMLTNSSNTNSAVRVEEWLPKEWAEDFVTHRILLQLWKYDSSNPIYVDGYEWNGQPQFYRATLIKPYDLPRQSIQMSRAATFVPHSHLPGNRLVSHDISRSSPVWTSHSNIQQDASAGILHPDSIHSNKIPRICTFWFTSEGILCVGNDIQTVQEDEQME